MPTAIPTEYGRVAELLARHAARFGTGFVSRSKEAVRCYRARAYLAACAMAGAAAESILLALTIAKRGDEEAVLREYRSGSGRGRVETSVTGRLAPPLRASWSIYMGLLKYWRDDAAHGAASVIDEEEAFTSILALMRSPGSPKITGPI